MDFEFDINKSVSNKVKHGIDFVEVQKVWQDPDRIEVPARTEDESRYLLVGRIDRQYWSVIFTYRKHAIRIISARRSRTEEVRLYEGEGF
jgi:uncharacterized DUF497 family protein